MKFNCGRTYLEKIKAKRKWHVWFAWHPVRLGSRDCRWLDHIERRFEYSYIGPTIHYREIDKEDKC